MVPDGLRNKVTSGFGVPVHEWFALWWKVFIL
jgi:hypothetical protein